MVGGLVDIGDQLLDHAVVIAQELDVVAFNRLKVAQMRGQSSGLGHTGIDLRERGAGKVAEASENVAKAFRHLASQLFTPARHLRPANEQVEAQCQPGRDQRQKQPGTGSLRELAAWERPPAFLAGLPTHWQKRVGPKGSRRIA